MAALTVATSIVPRNFELQRLAIESWLKLGFNVISLNSAIEAALVAENFPEIPIKIVRRTAETITGRPYVFVDDVLKVAGENSSGEVFGIINSDIILVAGDDFTEFLRQQASGGMVFGSRTEIATADAREGEMYIDGFDLFFIDPAILPLYPESGFCMGAPFWDYWAPLVPMLNAVSVKWLVTPVAYHVTHQVAWDHDHHLRFGRELVSLLQGNAFVTRLDDMLYRIIESTATAVDFYPFSLDVCNFIHTTAKKLYYPGTPNLSQMAIVAKSQFENLSIRCQALEAARRALEGALKESESARLRAEADYREAEILLSQSEGKTRWKMIASLKRLLKS
jgi:hypothetical protein